MIESDRLVRGLQTLPRRSVEHQLPAGRHDFQALFESAPVALLAVCADAPHFKIVAASDAYLRATMTVRDGPGGIVGRDLFEVFPDRPGDATTAGARNLRGSLARCIATGAPDEMPVQQYDLQRPDGSAEERFWRHVNSPVIDPQSGRVTHVIHRVDDITEAERSQRRTAEAQHAMTVAEEANAVKTRFLAAMSHELRTPLNAIAGYVDLLAMGIHGPVTHEQAQMLERVRHAGQHLLVLINEVLTYAKIEAGHLQLDAKPVAIREVLNDVEELVAPQARMKHVGLVFASAREPADRPMTIYADEEKLRQVVLNLLSNAIKFTDSGGAVTVICENAGDDRIVVRVADTGCGIAESDLERIFEPFVQAGHATTTPGGTGLGLPISRDLARAMGGDVTVASRLGKGSTFTLTLPRHARSRSAVTSA